MSLLRNRVVAITGSSSGIGRAMALKCASQGASILIHHLGTRESEKDAESLLSEIRDSPSTRNEPKQPFAKHTTIGVNLTSSGAAQKIVEHAVNTFGRLDTLVNNAGICRFSPALDVTAEKLQLHTDVNFKAAWLLTQAATKQMVAQQDEKGISKNGRGGGSIINISSITARLGSSELCHYAPAKAALLGMSTSFATAFGKYGIRYNSILPGTIETSMNRENLDQGDTRARMTSRVPLGRLGTPEDVAGAVVYFASDELSGYVTGQWMLVDGGGSIYYQE
ncbi:L-rhamnose-1-dehydrogenase [Talaromyces pinophilus]|nr:L-rhamnose-1-dehydrogenase [Talaromyces pinophilus]PCG95192.1 Short-chain dehydrogenase/reductase SDR [Penicillium occitanis (nom. inval.)]PCH07587.1 hypothetical protein PENOC_018020 [Penicillium occitanis (nom. inval.)]